jgi:hypothetical protein
MTLNDSPLSVFSGLMSLALLAWALTRERPALRRRLAHALGAVWAMALMAVGPSFAAENEEVDYTSRLETWGLAQSKRERDLEPAGKTIDEVLVVSEEIVAPTDPWPSFLNAFHARTRPDIVRRELLLKEGDLWDEERIEESERILRVLGQTAPVLAIVRILPVKSPTPGKVSMLVVTKDLWSIRVNSRFLLVGTVLKQLRIRPTENNLAGRNKQLSLDLDLQQATFGVGQQFSDPRVWGSNLAFVESASLIFNRRSQVPEGSNGSLEFGRPQYSLEDTWSAIASAAWSVSRARVFRGERVLELFFPDETSSIPYMYDASQVVASGSLTKSFGRRYRTDLSVALAGYTKRFEPFPEVTLTDEQREWYVRTRLPRSEDATYLSLTAAAYETDYRIYKNLHTFALREDIRLGYRLVAKARFAPKLLSSGSSFIEMGVAGGYGWDLGGNLFFLSAGVGERYMPEALSFGAVRPWVNGHAGAQVLDITPRVGPGRFVLRAMADLRWDDLDNTLVLLGGGNGLRGLPDGYLTGTREVLMNVEYRTLPLELFTVHLGLVFFWDAGAAYTAAPFSMTHTLGVGLRALFPQLDVEPFRLDFGLVLNGPQPAVIDRFSASFGQITDLRPEVLTNPLD